eukprot:6725200-Alexandrium_andersonii.AAC.1
MPVFCAVLRGSLSCGFLRRGGGCRAPPGSREFWARGSPTPRRRKPQEVSPCTTVQNSAEWCSA